ncbi:Holliday junction resolvase RuvX [Candidatus Nomurabacteria bacterium]|nr:Holliday junction resolvase RuvX [Candidatus Nomurabacteria bacterium]
MSTPRFLGIDFGTKRVGLAVSDDGGRLAFPAEILPNDKNIFEKISEILKEKNIEEVVVGESLNLYGLPNDVSSSIEIFISDLKNKFGIPVHKEKEFFTSLEARKVGKQKTDFNKSESHSKMKEKRVGKVDAVAAALILQRYLDRRNKNHD